MSLQSPTAAEVESYLRSSVRDGESGRYLAYHSARYAHLMRTVRDCVAGAGRAVGELRILDVGPNLQTRLLRGAHPDAVVDTLGFEHPDFGPRPGERHVHFDLNDAQLADRRPALDPYDVVVMAEVVEHLHVALPAVLECAAGWLRPSGRLVVQTPNACALHKRLRMLAGRNPCEPIRASRENPGHFHEFTLGELESAAGQAGMRTTASSTANYFRPDGLGGRLYGRLGGVLPPGLRHGITICLAADGEPAAVG